MPLNQNKLKMLQDRWEARLAKEGLGPARRSPNPYQSGTTGHDKITRQAKVQYYQMLSSHTARYAFNKPLDSVVMQLVAEGNSYVEVSKELKSLNYRRRTTARTISKIVKHYEKLWGIVRRAM